MPTALSHTREWLRIHLASEASFLGELLCLEGSFREKAVCWLHIKIRSSLQSCTHRPRRAVLQQSQALSPLVSENAWMMS